MSVYKAFQTDMQREILDRIIEERIKQDLTQAELARRAGKSLHYIQNTERGKFSTSLQNLEPVLDVLGLALKVTEK